MQRKVMVRMLGWGIDCKKSKLKEWLSKEIWDSMFLWQVCERCVRAMGVGLPAGSDIHSSSSEPPRTSVSTPLNTHTHNEVYRSPWRCVSSSLRSAMEGGRHRSQGLAYVIHTPGVILSYAPIPDELNERRAGRRARRDNGIFTTFSRILFPSWAPVRGSV